LIHLVFHPINGRTKDFIQSCVNIKKKRKKIEENTLSKFDINEGKKGQLIYLYLKEKYEFFTPKKTEQNLELCKSESNLIIPKVSFCHLTKNAERNFGLLLHSKDKGFYYLFYRRYFLLWNWKFF
jgi:hypothetical protein